MYIYSGESHYSSVSSSINAVCNSTYKPANTAYEKYDFCRTFMYSITDTSPILKLIDVDDWAATADNEWVSTSSNFLNGNGYAYTPVNGLNIFHKVWYFYDIHDGKYNQVCWNNGSNPYYIYSHGGFWDNENGYNSLSTGSNYYIGLQANFFGYYYRQKSYTSSGYQFEGESIQCSSIPTNINIYGLTSTQIANLNLQNVFYNAYSYSSSSSIVPTSNSVQTLLDISTNILSSINNYLPTGTNTSSSYNNVGYISPNTLPDVYNYYNSTPPATQGIFAGVYSTWNNNVVTKNPSTISLDTNWSLTHYKLLPFLMSWTFPFFYSVYGSSSSYCISTFTVIQPACIVINPVVFNYSDSLIRVQSTNPASDSTGTLSIDSNAVTDASFGIVSWPAYQSFSPAYSNYNLSSRFNYISPTFAIQIPSNIKSKTSSQTSVTGQQFSELASITQTAAINTTITSSQTLGRWSINSNTMAVPKYYGFDGSIKVGIYNSTYGAQFLAGTKNINTGIICQGRSDADTSISWVGISSISSYTNSNIPSYYVTSNITNPTTWYKINIHTTAQQNIQAKLVQSSVATSIMNSSNIATAFNNAANIINGTGSDKVMNIAEIYAPSGADHTSLTLAVAEGNNKTPLIFVTGGSAQDYTIYVAPGVYNNKVLGNSSYLPSTSSLVILSTGNNNVGLDVLDFVVNVPTITYTNTNNSSQSSKYVLIETDGSNKTITINTTYTHPGWYANTSYYKTCTYNSETNDYEFSNQITSTSNISQDDAPMIAESYKTLTMSANSVSGSKTLQIQTGENSGKAWDNSTIYKVIRYRATDPSVYTESTYGTYDAYIKNGGGIIIKQTLANLSLSNNSEYDLDRDIIPNEKTNIAVSLQSDAAWTYSFSLKTSSDKNTQVPAQSGSPTTAFLYLNSSGKPQNTSQAATSGASGYIAVPYSADTTRNTKYVLKAWLTNNPDVSTSVEIQQNPASLYFENSGIQQIPASGGDVQFTVASNSGKWEIYYGSNRISSRTTGDTGQQTVPYHVNGTDGTSGGTHVFTAYTTVKGTVTNGNATCYASKQIVFGQSGQEEDHSFKIESLVSSSTWAEVTNITFKKDGKNSYTDGTTTRVKITNTGNTSSTYTLVRSGTQFVNITWSDITLAKNASGEFTFSVPATTLDEDRQELWTIRETSGTSGYTRQLQITQLAGERNALFTLNGSTTLKKTIETGETLTRSIKVTNTGSIASDYKIELYNPYEYSGYTISLSGGDTATVNAGSYHTFSFTFSSNNTTERKSGFYAVVRDSSSYNISQTFYFSQDCYPDPFFIPSTVYTDSTCSGRNLSTNEYVNPGVNFRTNISNGSLPANAKSHLKYEITSNKPTYLNIGNLPDGGSSFIWNTVKVSNQPLEPVELEIYIDCFYDDTIESHTYTKSNPYRRTLQFVLTTEIKPELIVTSAGDNYVSEQSGSTTLYTYLFGPGTGTRSLGITDQSNSKDYWGVNRISGNSYSYAVCNPATNSSISTINISTTNNVVGTTSSQYGWSKYSINARSNTGVYVPTSAGRCDTGNNQDSSSNLDISVYRFPLPSLVVTHGRTNSTLNNDLCIFDCNGNNIITNGSSTVSYNEFYLTFNTSNNIALSSYSNVQTTYEYEMDNNLFELTYDNSTERLYINAPKNASISKSITGTLTVYYNYPSTVPDHTEDLVLKYTFIVKPATIPTISLNPDRTSYSFNYDGSPAESFGVSSNSEGYYPITISPIGSLDLTWIFEKEEFGTNGSEFKFVRTNNGIQFAVPVNTNINTYKECNLTISYWYTADSTKESLQTKYLTFNVAPAPELRIVPDASIQYAKGYNNDSDFNPINISITTSTGAAISQKTPVEWKIERATEFGTNGSEFNFRKVGDQIIINTVPDNMSINNTKSATVVAKAYYRGQEDSYSVNGIYEYIVNPMKRLTVQEVNINTVPSITRNSHSADITMNAFYIDDSTETTPEGVRYIAYKIIDASNNNLTDSNAVILKTNKTETGTNGNEYRITGTNITTDNNGAAVYVITVKIPSYNVSTTYQKECDITVEASYRNGDDDYIESNTKHYVIDIAPKFYVDFIADPDRLNNYTYDGIRRDRNTDTITPKFVLKDVNTNQVLNNVTNTRINQFLMWTFSTDETNTTGREFTVSHDPNAQASSTTLPGGYVYNQSTNNWYTVTAPENFITNKDKTCIVTLTTKYLNNNDDFVVNYDCRYIVSAAGRLVLSFTDERDAQFDWKYDLTTDTVVPLNGENNKIEIGLNELNGESFNIYTDTDYIAWSFEKSEVNTNGNEFSVSKNNVDGLAINTLPKNTSTSTAKICNITFKAWYRAGDPNEFATLTGVYRVIPATGFTTEIAPRTFTFDPDGQGLTDLSTYINIKDASGNYIHDNLSDISINIVPEYINSVESEWSYLPVPDTNPNNDTYYWIKLTGYPTNTTTSSKELKLNVICSYTNGSYSISDTITYKVLPSGFPEIKFINLSTMVQSDTLTLEFGPDEDTQHVYLITNKRNDLLKAESWYYYNRAVTPPEKSNVSGRLDLYVGDKIVGYMDKGFDRFVEQTVENSDQTVWLSEFAVTLYDSENIINNTEFSVYLIGDNIIGDSPFITLTIKQQKASTEYKPQIYTGSVFYDPSNSKFYNMGFPYYWSNKDEIADKWSESWPENTTDDYEFNRIIFNRNVAEVVAESEGIEIQRVSDLHPVDINYHQRKDSEFPYITVDPDLRSKNNNVIQRFNVSLSYTNALFGFAVTDPPTEYKYRAYATVRYRLGSSDPDKWHEEKIYGEWVPFTYLALYNKDEEFIRPYFKPMEHEKGYLTGTEVKNFINSKGVVFNRSENNIIELTNFFNNYEIVDGKIKINVTNALIEHILYSEAFNKAWNYINDSDNLLKAKTAYIRNIILPNIIVNADSVVEIYENSKSDSLGVSISKTDNFEQIENTGTHFEIEENQDKTIVFNSLKNKTYFFKVKVSF